MKGSILRKLGRKLWETKSGLVWFPHLLGVPLALQKTQSTFIINLVLLLLLLVYYLSISNKRLTDLSLGLVSCSSQMQTIYVRNPPEKWFYFKTI